MAVTDPQSQMQSEGEPQTHTQTTKGVKRPFRGTNQIADHFLGILM